MKYAVFVFHLSNKLPFFKCIFITNFLNYFRVIQELHVLSVSVLNKYRDFCYGLSEHLAFGAKLHCKCSDTVLL